MGVLKKRPKSVWQVQAHGGYDFSLLIKSTFSGARSSGLWSTLEQVKGCGSSILQMRGAEAQRAAHVRGPGRGRPVPAVRGGSAVIREAQVHLGQPWPFLWTLGDRASAVLSSKSCSAPWSTYVSPESLFKGTRAHLPHHPHLCLANPGPSFRLLWKPNPRRSASFTPMKPPGASAKMEGGGGRRGRGCSDGSGCW